MKKEKINALIKIVEEALNQNRGDDIEDYLNGRLSAFETVLEIIEEEEKKNVHITLVRCSITEGCTLWKDEEGNLWKFPFCSGCWFCKQGGVEPNITMDIIPEMLHWIADKEIVGDEGGASHKKVGENLYICDLVCGREVDKEGYLCDVVKASDGKTYKIRIKESQVNGWTVGDDITEEASE